MTKEMSWRKAIEKVLSEASGALDYKDIAEKIISDDLRSNLGATPTSTVSALLGTAINDEGKDCPFQRISRGLYIWKETAEITRSTVVGKEASEEKEEGEDDQYDIISSFGMFWRRDAIDWVSTIEAIMIEALEPRQNRKRGDDLSAVEYIQKEDPEIQKKRAKQTIEAALNKL
ncbi:MAG: winged helix-turn-helix domain-containing protein [Planctomycetota bacterium]